MAVSVRRALRKGAAIRAMPIKLLMNTLIADHIGSVISTAHMFCQGIERVH